MPAYVPPPKKNSGCGTAALVGGITFAVLLAGLIVLGVFMFRAMQDAPIRNIPWAPMPGLDCPPGQEDTPWDIGPPRGIWGRDARDYTNDDLGISIEFPWDWHPYCDACITRFFPFDGAFELSNDRFTELAASREIETDDSYNLINLLIHYEQLDDTSMTAEQYMHAVNALRAADGDELMDIHDSTTQIGRYLWHSFSITLFLDYYTRPVHTYRFVHVRGGFARVININFLAGTDTLEDILALLDEAELDDLHGELRPLGIG